MPYLWRLRRSRDRDDVRALELDEPVGDLEAGEDGPLGLAVPGGCWVVSTPNMVQVSFSRVTSMTL